MSKSKSKPPRLCLHKASGRAVVRLNGKDHYCGKYGTPAADSHYHRLLSEYYRTGLFPSETISSFDTISEMAFTYLEYVKTHYQKNGCPTSEVSCQKSALRFVTTLYYDLHPDDFGPLCLKNCRNEMIRADLTRLTINRHVQRIRYMFRWAAENEYIDPSHPHRLDCVIGLRRGRGGRETTPRRPAPYDAVQAVKPHVSPQVWTMIELQWFSGMRPGEVRIMRTGDLTTDSDIWIYRPASHKTEHHDHSRLIALGPHCRRILAPWLRDNPAEYLFSPAEAEADRNALRRCRHQGPYFPSHLPSRRRSRRRRRPPADHYDKNSYRRAILRACDAAGITPWTPHQLRHSFATRADKHFGLEIVSAALGHQSPSITQLYISRDLARAREVARRLG